MQPKPQLTEIKLDLADVLAFALERLRETSGKGWPAPMAPIRDALLNLAELALGAGCETAGFHILVSGLVALHANMRIRVPANATPAERAQYAEDDATSGRDYDLLVQALGATKFVQSLTEAFVHEKYGDDYALLDAEFRTAQAGPTPEVLDLDVPPANDPGAN